MTNTNQAVELFEKNKKSPNKLPFSIKGDPDRHNYIDHPKENGYRSIKPMLGKRWRPVLKDESPPLA
jgi:hypothetical protein